MQIYNTFSQQKETFNPLIPNKVSLYVCGVTVYDYCHIGHARVYLSFDVIVRYLQYRGFEVCYVRNITDIDDKIIHKAFENQESIQDLSHRFISTMQEDFEALHLLKPSAEPKATEHLEGMIQMIQQLIDQGYAYVADNGDIYYRVASFDSYGALAHRTLAQLKVGARVERNESKDNPLDFVLWKKAKAQEPAWDSPWGLGRPGWHSECSVMSFAHLGQTIDIHGGGMDLIFPHHENERAQSEVCNQAPFVKYWMHVGFVQQNKEKMSKSLGNFLTIRDFLGNYHPEVLRHFAIASHYRSPIDYTLDQIDGSIKALTRLYHALRGLDGQGDVLPQPCNDKQSVYEQRFVQCMDDDFNTPEALAVLFDLAREINRLRASDELEQATELAIRLKKLGRVLGLLQEDPEAFLRGGGHAPADRRTAAVDPQAIKELIIQRHEARAMKNWAEADRIRDHLLEQGIRLDDTAQGTRWQ